MKWGCQILQKKDLGKKMVYCHHKLMVQMAVVKGLEEKLKVIVKNVILVGVKLAEIVKLRRTMDEWELEDGCVIYYWYRCPLLDSIRNNSVADGLGRSLRFGGSQMMVWGCWIHDLCWLRNYSEETLISRCCKWEESRWVCNRFWWCMNWLPTGYSLRYYPFHWI